MDQQTFGMNLKFTEFVPIRKCVHAKEKKKNDNGYDGYKCSKVLKYKCVLYYY